MGSPCNGQDGAIPYPQKSSSRPISRYRIRRDVLAQLPPLHRLAAEDAIKRGEWVVIE